MSEPVQIAACTLDVGGVRVPLTRLELLDLRDRINLLIRATAKPSVKTLREVPFIAEMVAREYSVNVNAILSNSREMEVCWARHVAMSIARELLPLESERNISRNFTRDRSNLYHSLKAARNRLDTEPEVRARYHALRERIRAAIAKQNIESISFSQSGTHPKTVNE